MRNAIIDTSKDGMLEAVKGFEVHGPDGDAVFRAENSIRLGPGFIVHPQGRFRAVIETPAP